MRREKAAFGSSVARVSPFGAQLLRGSGGPRPSDPGSSPCSNPRMRGSPSGPPGARYGTNLRPWGAGAGVRATAHGANASTARLSRQAAAASPWAQELRDDAEDGNQLKEDHVLVLIKESGLASLLAHTAMAVRASEQQQQQQQQQATAAMAAAAGAQAQSRGQQGGEVGAAAAAPGAITGAPDLAPLGSGAVEWAAGAGAAESAAWAGAAESAAEAGMSTLPDSAADAPAAGVGGAASEAAAGAGGAYSGADAGGAMSQEPDMTDEELVSGTIHLVWGARVKV